MKKISEKFIAVFMAMVMVLSCVAVVAGAYTVEEAYEECAQIYPDFVANVKAQGVNDAKIIVFLESVQEYLLNLDIEITEDNFEEYIIEAVNAAISLRKNIAVRNALIAAYPDAVVDGVDGIINEQFIPIVETIKNIIFEHGMLEEESDNPTENVTEPTTEKETEAPTENVTEPTEKDTEAPTEGATTPTEKETEKDTEGTTAPTEKETDKTDKPDIGGSTGRDDEEYEVPDETEKATEKESEKATDKPTEQKSFTDMNQAAWAEQAVNALVGMGIISGYPDGTFQPNKNITRAEFAKIIVLASGQYDKDAKVNFTDVPENAWYYSYVASAYKLGFINGRSETIFDPNSNITRADLCTIVYRFVLSINSEIKPATTQVVFADDAAIPSYAKTAVYALNAAGVVGGMGDNKFAPLQDATRAQSAKIVHGAINTALGI